VTSLLLYIVFAAMASAFVAPALVRWIGDRASVALAVVPASVVAIILFMLGPPPDGVLQSTIPWIPSLGINLSFWVDGLSVIFVLLIAGIGTVVLVYAGPYLHGHRDLGRFLAWIMLFMGSMLGLVTSGNLLTLFLFWELTSVSSYFLIGFLHDDAASRKSALQALLITGAGGLSLLAGFILLGSAVGTYELSVILSSGDAFRSSAWYLPGLFLILAGAFTKSAQVPFHFWLPNAMAAPTPVSAYLHSATMVKAGVFLLARLHMVLNGTTEFHVLVGMAGAATMLLGAVAAFGQRDLKRLLAYTTVSALGTLVFLLGIGSEAAVQAAMVFLLAHALYKGTLFLVVGIVDHETGTRDLESLGGLWRVMPKTAAAAALAALSMAGLPPMLGFISKELLYEAKLAAPWAPWTITAAGVAANVLTVATAALIVVRTFGGRAATPTQTVHDPSWMMWGGVVLLSSLGFAAGLAAEAVATYIVGPAATAIRGKTVATSLGLWHGVNPVLLLSLATLAAGAALYAFHRPLRRAVSAWRPWKAEGAYDAALAGMLAGARQQTLWLQSGQLSTYLALTLTATLVLVGLPIAVFWPQLSVVVTSELALLPTVIAGTMAIAAVLAVRARTSLGAIIALGVVGYGIAVLFLLYSAPDLAMTQFAVETLMVVLLMLVVAKLPEFRQLGTRASRMWQGALSVAGGALMTLLVLLVTAEPARMALANFYSESALALANGRNIVNVILVDFRGLDTMGEITVLGIAALGAVALLRLGVKREDDR
jgi:multicomponent Na+:H+ antiporter subunit A